jgi:hypothetical protein
MYDPHEVLARISDNPWPIVVLCGIALAFNYAWYAEDIRVARRDRCYTMPPAVTLVYLAHDGSYLLLAGRWWGEYQHWFTQLFWVALVFTFAGEVVIFAQTLRYGRAELAPRLTQRGFVAVMLAGLVLTACVWAAVKSALGDDLYLLSFMALIFWAAPFGSALMLRRNRGRGSTRWMWVSATMIGVLYGLATVLYFGPAFHSPAWVLLWLGAAAWGGYNVWLAHRLVTSAAAPDREPAAAGVAARASPADRDCPGHFL